MKTKPFLLSSLIALLFSIGCQSEPQESGNGYPPPSNQPNDSAAPSPPPMAKPTGFELFVDSMRRENYLLDTTRIQQTVWSTVIPRSTAVDNGYPIFLFPFPVRSFASHFTDPKTYFFAQWNAEQQTFKNGNDFLLMTWTMDSAGIENEATIYQSLIQWMGNFPCFIFRDKDRVYALGHRLTVHAPQTHDLAKQLQAYIHPDGQLYGQIFEE